MTTSEAEEEVKPHWETACPKREDMQHCECWYDGDGCCACGDGPAEWCAACGYHVNGGLCGYYTPCEQP